LGRESKVARFVDDFVFLGFGGFSLDFAAFSESFPARDFNETELNVFLCSDFGASSVVAERFPSLDFFGDKGGGLW